MHRPATRVGRLVRQLDERITDLEQGRPPDAPERRVENVGDETTGSDDTVAETRVDDPTMSYNSGDNYNQSEYP